jgi:hypothetical protein
LAGSQVSEIEFSIVTERPAGNVSAYPVLENQGDVTERLTVEVDYFATKTVQYRSGG